MWILGGDSWSFPAVQCTYSVVLDISTTHHLGIGVIKFPQKKPHLPSRKLTACCGLPPFLMGNIYLQKGHFPKLCWSTRRYVSMMILKPLVSDPIPPAASHHQGNLRPPGLAHSRKIALNPRLFFGELLLVAIFLSTYLPRPKTSAPESYMETRTRWDPSSIQGPAISARSTLNPKGRHAVTVIAGSRVNAWHWISISVANHQLEIEISAVWSLFSTECKSQLKGGNHPTEASNWTN